MTRRRSWALDQDSLLVRLDTGGAWPRGLGEEARAVWDAFRDRPGRRTAAELAEEVGLPVGVVLVAATDLMHAALLARVDPGSGDVLELAARALATAQSFYRARREAVQVLVAGSGGDALVYACSDVPVERVHAPAGARAPAQHATAVWVTGRMALPEGVELLLTSGPASGAPVRTMSAAVVLVGEDDGEAKRLSLDLAERGVPFVLAVDAAPAEVPPGRAALVRAQAGVGAGVPVVGMSHGYRSSVLEVLARLVEHAARCRAIGGGG